MTNLLDYFSALNDPRQSAKVIYQFPEILLTAPGGVMAGRMILLKLNGGRGVN